MLNNFFTENTHLNEFDRKKFAAWFEEYSRDLQISSFIEENEKIFESDGAAEEHVKELQKSAEKKHHPICPGQIRMLDFSFTSDADQITNVLVLSQWTDDSWLIAPFSPYETPATQGELTVESDFHAYKTIEAWNAFCVSEFFLTRRSDYLRDASEDTRKDACDLFFHLLENKDLSVEMSKRVGPPIADEWDPRIQYLLKEQDQISPAKRESERLENLLKSFVLIVEEPQVAAFAAAAAEKDLYILFNVTGFSEKISIVYNQKEKVLRCKVIDEAEGYSHRFDTWTLLNSHGQTLGQFADCKCIVKDISLQNLRLGMMDPTGEPKTLIPAKE